MLTIFLITIVQFINGVGTEKQLCEYPNWTIAQNVLFYYQRVELLSEVSCAEQCIENGDHCHAALFMTIESASKKKFRRRNFCQFYNVNSEDLVREIKTRQRSSIDVDTNLDIENLTNSTILFEILNKCPRDAINDDAANSTYSKLNSAAKRKLRLLINEKKILNKISSASPSHLNHLENIDEYNSENKNSKENLLVLLKDGVLPARENILDLSGNSKITGSKDLQKHLHNKSLSKETMMIGITDRVAPIRPASVSYKGYFKGFPFNQLKNCQNGICDFSSLAYQQSPNAAAIETSKPCSARHASDPCAKKLTLQWTEWSPGGFCSVTCGKGIRKLIRFCNNATGCEGESTKVEPCEIIDCNIWGKWSEWSRCSVSCGKNGQMMRERRCLNGNHCEGSPFDVRSCREVECSYWGAWAAWSLVPGDGGWRMRQRECLPKGQICQQGLSIEREPCELDTYPLWANWGVWSKCTKTCGGGEMVRQRECRNGLDNNCKGPNEERNQCNLQECPTWGEWTFWSSCSQSCGSEGNRLRSRECRYNNIKSNSCEGPAQDQMSCQLEKCPYWDSWSEWSGCSSTCGHGQQKRLRECKPSNKGCKGGNQEIRFCQLTVCPYFDQWSEWNGCSVTCGRGFCERRRNNTLPTEELIKFNSTSQNGMKPILKTTRSTLFDSVDVKSINKLEELQNNRRTDNENIEAIKAEIIDRSKNFNSQRPRLQDHLLAVRQSSLTYLPERRRTSRNLIEYSGENVSGCVGPEVERKECDAGPCCNWSQWTGWGHCVEKCGMGSKTSNLFFLRNRKCLVEPDFQTNLTASDFVQNPELAVPQNYRSIVPQNSETALPKRQLQFPASYALKSEQNLYGNFPFPNELSNSNIQHSMPSPSTISGTCDCPGRSLEIENCEIAVSVSDLCAHNISDDSKDKKQSSYALNDAVLNHYSNFVEKTNTQNNSNSIRHAACSWGTWTEYNECSGTCARAMHSRSRECIRREFNCDCNGKTFESKECQMPDCFQTFALPSLSNGYKLLNSRLPSHEADYARLIYESEIISENYKRKDNERRSPSNDDLEKLIIIPENTNSTESDENLININVTKSNRHRFQDPHWNSAKNGEILRQQDSVESFDAKPQQSLLANSKKINENEKYCRWLEWREWSECISFSSTNNCQSEWERTRSRICPCSSCEDGITQESEGCLPEPCRQ